MSDVRHCLFCSVNAANYKLSALRTFPGKTRFFDIGGSFVRHYHYEMLVIMGCFPANVGRPTLAVF